MSLITYCTCSVVFTCLSVCLCVCTAVSCAKMAEPFVFMTLSDYLCVQRDGSDAGLSVAAETCYYCSNSTDSICCGFVAQLVVQKIHNKIKQ